MNRKVTVFCVLVWVVLLFAVNFSWLEWSPLLNKFVLAVLWTSPALWLVASHFWEQRAEDAADPKWYEKPRVSEAAFKRLRAALVVIFLTALVTSVNSGGWPLPNLFIFGLLTLFALAVLTLRENRYMRRSMFRQAAGITPLAKKEEGKTD